MTRTARRAVAVGLALSLVAGIASAQQRTVESAQEFLHLYMKQTPVKVEGFYTAKPDTNQLALLSEKGFSVTGVEARGCDTVFRAGSRTRDIDWSTVTSPSLVRFSTRYGPYGDEYFPMILVSQPQDERVLVFWLPHEADAERLLKAMEFLAKSCNPATATGF